MSRSVHQPRQDVVYNVRNQSTRSSGIVGIVLHDTESVDLPGLTDLKAIGNWFDNPAAEASAHICVDGDGNTGRYVPDKRKAWACANYNSQTLNIEQIGRATYSSLLWNRNKRAQLKKVAKWIAWWSKEYDLPIQRGAVLGGRVAKRGVLLHSDLGAIGGGHHDPGPGYPTWLVIRMAKWYARYGWR